MTSPYVATVVDGSALAALEWVDALLELERETLAPLHAATGQAFPAERRRAGLVAKDAIVVIVHRGGAPVAAAHFVRDWNDAADLYVASVVVAPASRRGPALRLLLETALEAVRMLKWRRLTSNVHPTNHAALALAGRLGFRRVPARGRRSVGLALERGALDGSSFARRMPPEESDPHPPLHPPSSRRRPMRQVTLAEVSKVLSEDFASSYATDQEQTNGELLQRILEAIAAGRYDELRGWLAPDVSFELAAPPRFPWIRSAEGVDAVIEAIAHNFCTVTEQMPQPLALVAQGDTVMVMARKTGRLVESGEPYEVLLAHQFTFRDGRLVLSRSVSAETAA